MYAACSRQRAFLFYITGNFVPCYIKTLRGDRTAAAGASRWERPGRETGLRYGKVRLGEPCKKRGNPFLI
ncbi:hypothetical protein CLOM621_06469 [Clostridium sp. M62/1]|nr:hypothetical protein CLOM621_06469 [Clostridium sp. M62/1]